MKRNNAELVANHYNSLDRNLATRNDSNILYLRNFNNWIKSNLIQDVVSRLGQRNEVRVLDLGSGKGGDLLKWGKAKVGHISLLDIAQDSVAESERRYRGGRFSFSADFHVVDFTKTDFRELLTGMYDVVSCQFAVHYSFESMSQATTTVKNVAECLRRGGLFVGTTVNSLELVRRLGDRRQFGNSVYRVRLDDADTNQKQEDEDSSNQKSENVDDGQKQQHKESLEKRWQPALFGAQYHFWLEGAVDCPEYAVHPGLMDRICAGHGLQLVERLGFPDFFQRHQCTREGRQLLGRIRALQDFTQPPVTSADTATSEDTATTVDLSDKEGEHVRAARSDLKPGQQLLSITAAEWQVASLYDVFLYQRL